jgi:hypothetical protein
MKTFIKLQSSQPQLLHYSKKMTVHPRPEVSERIIFPHITSSAVCYTPPKTKGSSQSVHLEYTALPPDHSLHSEHRVYRMKDSIPSWRTFHPSNYRANVVTPQIIFIIAIKSSEILEDNYFPVHAPTASSRARICRVIPHLWSPWLWW